MRKVVVLSALLAMVGTAGAVEIFAINNLAGGGTGSNSLIKFDSANPAGWTTVGLLGLPTAGVGGLDFDAAGNLYGYASYSTPPSGLYSINKTTGAATLIGNSGQTLQDLAFNPANNTMYGINGTSLYSVNLANGGTTLVGNFTGLPSGTLPVGLACDSAGTFYIHDLVSPDTIYKATLAGLAATSYITLPIDTNYSQGMTIDWSRNNQGYHGALGGTTGTWFSDLYTFATPASPNYTLVGNFGTAHGTFPTVEAGDLAILPVPEPASLLLLGALALLRRR